MAVLLAPKSTLVLLENIWWLSRFRLIESFLLKHLTCPTFYFFPQHLSYSDTLHNLCVNLHTCSCLPQLRCKLHEGGIFVLVTNGFQETRRYLGKLLDKYSLNKGL